VTPDSYQLATPPALFCFVFVFFESAEPRCLVLGPAAALLAAAAPLDSLAWVDLQMEIERTWLRRKVSWGIPPSMKLSVT